MSRYRAARDQRLGQTIMLVFGWLLLVRLGFLLHSGVRPEIGRMLLSDVAGALVLTGLLTLARARRLGYELYVWTVNQPEDMSTFIDMGVDSIITDRPDVLARILAQRKQLSDAERLAVKLRSWLR